MSIGVVSVGMTSGEKGQADSLLSGEKGCRKKVKAGDEYKVKGKTHVVRRK